MPRNVTVTFRDGTNHVYQNVPDDATPDQVTARVQNDFADKEVVALDGGKKAAPDYRATPPDKASAALTAAQAHLADRMKGKPASVVADAQRRFEADPTIRQLTQAAHPPEKHTVLGDLGRGTINAAAGAIQGAASLPDMVTDGIGGVLRYGAQAVGGVGGPALRAVGLPGAAASLESTTAGLDKAWAHPATIGGMVEKVAPTPQDSNSQNARTISQLFGGLVSPANRLLPTPPAASAIPLRKFASPTIVQDGNRAGVRVMTSDVKPPRTFIGKVAQSTGERIPFAGTGGPRQAQQVERIAAAKSVLNDYGAVDAGSAVDDVAADLLKTRGAALTKLTKAKTAVIEQAPGVVPVSATTRAIDDQIASLKAIGTDATKPVIAKLQDWRQAIQNKGLPIIESIRKEMGAAFSAPELSASRDTGEKALSAIYGPIRADMGAHIEATLGKGAATRWGDANMQLSAMAGELNSATLKNVLKTGELSPENVSKLLFSAKPSDVQRLYANLSPQGRARAQSAIMHRVMEKAGGIDSLSPERFVSEMGRVGKQTGVFFDGADKARLDGLVRVLKATSRASGASVAPPTGVQAVPYAMGAGLTGLFGMAGGVVAGGGLGLLTRAYESAPVRDMLLRLSKTAPGSPQEASILKKLLPAMSATAVGSAKKIGLNDNVGVPAAASDGEEQKQKQQTPLSDFAPSP